MKADHDNSYKLMFSHAELVRDLLTGFVDEPWLAELDLATLEKANGSYVADDLRDREDDVIWRVRFKERWLYLYILLEFQSTVDAHMAVRVLTYLGLLYQDLIRQGQAGEDGKLPPVLPIVLYNGKPRWSAATEIADLIDTPPGRQRDYAPRFKYLLLDEGAIDESGPWALKNLAAAIFRLEKSRGTASLAAAVGALVDWLGARDQAGIRRAFTVWIRRALLPARFPGINLPEMGDLLEIKTMLAESVMEWTQEWLQQGIQQGEAKGKVEGKAEEASLILQRLLARRFGPLSEETHRRLSAASLEQLETWVERIFDAASLDALFDGH
jgi:predicted transposase YdaD